MCFWAQPLVCLIASPHSSRHPIHPCSTKNRLNLPDSARSFLMVTSVTASFVCFWKLVLTCAPGILSTIPLPATSSSLLTARSHPATAQRLLSNKWFNLVSGLCLLFESATVQSKKNIYSMLKKKLVDFKLNCVKEFNKSFFITFHSVFRNQRDVKTFGCNKQQVDWCPAPGEPQIAES